MSDSAREERGWEERGWSRSLKVLEKWRRRGNWSMAVEAPLEILYNWKASLKMGTFLSLRHHIKVSSSTHVDRIEGDKRIYYEGPSVCRRVCARSTSHEYGNDYSGGTLFRVIKISAFNLRYWTNAGAKSGTIAIHACVMVTSASE